MTNTRLAEVTETVEHFVKRPVFFGFCAVIASLVILYQLFGLQQTPVVEAPTAAPVTVEAFINDVTGNVTIAPDAVLESAAAMPGSTPDFSTEAPVIHREKADGDEIIHLMHFYRGAENTIRLENLLKSILLFHNGTIHMHVFSDERGQRALSLFFQTWRIANVRWSLYSLLDAIEKGPQFMPIFNGSRTDSFLRMFAHDLLPLDVERVMIIDANVTFLDDISNVHAHFEQMDKQGAFFGLTKTLIKRSPMRRLQPFVDRGGNEGILLLDLRRMRAMNWDEIWMSETVRWVHKFGMLADIEQDILNAIEYAHPEWAYRLPCLLNFQVGMWTEERWCQTMIGEKESDYDAVKNFNIIRHFMGTFDSYAADYFTRINQCMSSIPWKLLIGNTESQNMNPAKTLAYILDAAPEKDDEITLAIVTPAKEVYGVIDRVSAWPASLSLVVHGTDAEKGQLIEFLRDNKHIVSPRLSVHFVAKPEKLEPRYHAYLAKLQPELVNTKRVFIAEDIAQLDVSKETYEKLLGFDSEAVVEVYAMSSTRIGYSTTKLHAERIVAEKMDLQAASKILGWDYYTTTLAAAAATPGVQHLQQQWIRKPLATVDFCRREMGKRLPDRNMTLYFT